MKKKLGALPESMLNKALSDVRDKYRLDMMRMLFAAAPSTGKCVGVTPYMQIESSPILISKPDAETIGGTD